MIKIVCISDTHNQLDLMDIPDGDILVHAGDFTMGGKEKEIHRFREDMAMLPHEHKIVIAGNHDLMFQHDYKRARMLLGKEMTYLQDVSIEVMGLTFYGHPWTPCFGWGWAFNSDKPPMPPMGIDVLISHGPPLGVLDWVDRGENVGCPTLKKYVDNVELKAHIFGHIHEGYGQEGIFVNASSCTLQYAPMNPPIVLELEA